jgi:hypothetical protein
MADAVALDKLTAILRLAINNALFMNQLAKTATLYSDK